MQFVTNKCKLTRDMCFLPIKALVTSTQHLRRVYGEAEWWPWMDRLLETGIERAALYNKWVVILCVCSRPPPAADYMARPPSSLQRQ